MQRPYNLMLDAENYHRRSIRLAGYNYSSNGAYFVTLCSKDKKPVFGRIRDSVMQPNHYGAIALKCWLGMPEHFPWVSLDEFILMPNHFHAILVVESSPATSNTLCTLGTLVQSFKSSVTRQTNLYRQSHNLQQVRVWQRNYYERIIRDERELDQIRRYIAENPAHWQTDKDHPDRM